MTDMDKFPLMLEGKPAGELAAEREGLYTLFSARFPLRAGLWCAWAVGDQGELRLGVMEPEGDWSVIRRRFSGRLTAPLGRLLRGEIRPAGEKEPEVWEQAPAPDRLFRAPLLCRQLKGTQGALSRKVGDVRHLALPYDPGKPFPLPALFCFARLRSIGETAYVVYAFDGQDRPVF